MADLLYEEFGGMVSERSTGRVLQAIDWTRKRLCRIAQQHDDDLRAKFQFDIAEHPSKRPLFVDETGSNTRIGYKPWGWSPRGSKSVQGSKFGRVNRWQNSKSKFTKDLLMLHFTTILF